MEELQRIDSLLTNITSEIKNYAKGCEFTSSEEFILTEKKEKELLANIKSAGIYFFEIKTNNEKSFAEWKNNFTKCWENIEHSPNLIKKRINEHKELHDWMPLYIGKRKDLRARVNQHLTLIKGSKTVGMKLCAREKLWGKQFRVSILKVDATINNYDMIMPIIENFMRERHNPIIGKQ